MPGRVLIAEDNAALRAIIELTVSRAGYETVVASNGAAALRAALDSPFDLVVSDHQMPQMTGIDLLAELRRHEPYRETPFVLLTAKKLELNADELRDRLGVAEVLPKPFSPKRLVELLGSLAAAAV